MVQVDKETCIGCEVCTTVCKDVFEMVTIGDEEKATVKLGKESEDNDDYVKEAIDACPVYAIS